MPQIIVRSDPAGDQGGAVLLRERVHPANLESDHFAAQLLERVGWALLDADEAERAGEIRAERIEQERGRRIRGTEAMIERELGHIVAH